MLDGMLQHIGHTSVFGSSAFALVAIIGIDFTLTFVHALQEFRGRLWRYFGAIAGLSIPDAAGVTLFFVVLTLILWTAGWIGITGQVPGFGQSEPLAAAAVGILIGGRLSDRR